MVIGKVNGLPTLESQAFIFFPAEPRHSDSAIVESPEATVLRPYRKHSNPYGFVLVLFIMGSKQEWQVRLATGDPEARREAFPCQSDNTHDPSSPPLSGAHYTSSVL